jgi:hypothetical protein
LEISCKQFECKYFGGKFMLLKLVSFSLISDFSINSISVFVFSKQDGCAKRLNNKESMYFSGGEKIIVPLPLSPKYVSDSNML